MRNMTFVLKIFCAFQRLSVVFINMEKGYYAVKWNDNFDRSVRSIACFVVLTQNWSGGSMFYPV